MIATSGTNTSDRPLPFVRHPIAVNRPKSAPCRQFEDRMKMASQYAASIANAETTTSSMMLVVKATTIGVLKKSSEAMSPVVHFVNNVTMRYRRQAVHAAVTASRHSAAPRGG